MTPDSYPSCPTGGASSSGLSLRAKGVAIISVPIVALFVAMFAVRWIGTESVAAEQAIEREYQNGDARRAFPADREQELRLADLRALRDSARRRLSGILLCCGILGPLGALFMHLLISDKLAWRLRAVQENARRLAHGLPLAPFPTGTDEIATLARQLEDAAHIMRARERELRESEGRYRNLFDRAPIPYEETDAHGVIRRFNQEVSKLLKTTPDRILGRKAWDFVAPDQQQSFREAMLERMAAARETDPFECEFLLEDGSRITVEIRESLIRRANGDVIGICRSLLDVTERNLAAMAARKVAQYAMELSSKNGQLARALDAARSATEAKSRFLAAVSHELRTPLNGIIGFSEMMYDEKLGTIAAEQKEILGDILTSARHLLQLINDILDLSKVEAGKMEFRPEPCEIDALIREVRDVLRPLAERKGIEVRTDVPAGLHGVIDRSRFKQVLYNYLSNAVKFTMRGGRVWVRARMTSAGSVRMEVEDTGVGILPEEMPLLFHEFQQLPNSRKAEQGTGLGLALTRHIVEAQGGAVEVRSIPGQGSVFSAILPLNGVSECSVR
jgi:PAS domain S-box-containing protein